MPLDEPISNLPAWTGSTANFAADLLALVNGAVTKKISPNQLFLNYGISSLPTGVDTPIANNDTIAVMMANLQAQISNKTSTRVLYANTTVASGTNGPSPYTVNTISATKSTSLILPVSKLGQKIKISALARYLSEPGSNSIKSPVALLQVGGIQVGGLTSPAYPALTPSADAYSRITGYNDVTMALECELTVENISLGVARFNGITRILATGTLPDSTYPYYSTLKQEDYLITVSLSDNSGAYYDPFTYNITLYPSVSIQFKVGDSGQATKWYIHHLSVEFIDK